MSRNHNVFGWACIVIMVDGDSDLAPTHLCLLTVLEGGLNKKTMVSVSTSVLERVATPALPLKPDDSVPPNTSLVLFEFLSLY